MPFRNQFERDIHFRKHGSEFGATDAADYERMADRFMFGTMDPDTHECTRPRGFDRIRFGYTTYIEGVACTNPVYLRTFYVVNPFLVAGHGGNQGYFTCECARMNL